MNNIEIKQFLYSYSGGGKELSDNIKTQLKDKLIFDIDRKSIISKETEFGYVSVNTDQILLSDNSKIYLSIDSHNVISLLKYVPLEIVSFTLSLTSNGETVTNKVLKGASLTIHAFSFSFKSSSNVNKVEIVFPDYQNAIINENLSSMNGDTLKIHTFNYGVPGDPASSLTFPFESSFTFRLRLSTENGETTEKSISIMSYNKVLVFEQTDMSFTTINDLLTGATIKYDSLGTTHKNININCTNGPGKYVFVAVPGSISGGINGVLNGAATQEFENLGTFRYNSGFSDDNYTLFKATGQNWNGSSLKFI